MTPIPLEEPTKKDLAEEYRNMNKKELIDKIDDLELQLEDELIHKRMNDINTFQAHENEVYLRHRTFRIYKRTIN